MTSASGTAQLRPASTAAAMSSSPWPASTAHLHALGDRARERQVEPRGAGGLLDEPGVLERPAQREARRRKERSIIIVPLSFA